MEDFKGKYSHIQAILRDKEQKKEKVFFTIKFEKYGSTTVAAERKAGLENFSLEFNNVLLTYNPDVVLVELFTGASHNSKGPFFTARFKISAPSAEISLGNPLPVHEKAELKNAEAVFSPEHFYNDKLSSMNLLFQKEMHIKLLEFELKAKNEKIVQLEQEVKENEEEILELEQLLQKPEKKLSLGGIHLGEVFSYAGENFLKRNPGILKGLLGLSNEQFKGIWSEMDEETKELENKQPGEPSTVKVKESGDEMLSEGQKKHLVLADHLYKFFKGIPAGILRLYYEIALSVQADEGKLQKIFLYCKKLSEEKTIITEKNNLTDENKTSEITEEKNEENESPGPEAPDDS